MRLRVGARTDIGLVRELNEDVYLANVRQRVFIVCDGMGGAPAGEVASEWAAKTILEGLHGAGEDALAIPEYETYLPETRRLAAAVRRSNRFIYDMACSDPRRAGMGTTVVGAWMTDHVACVAHVGDSRAYLWHEGRLELVTRDHSLAEALLNAKSPVEGQPHPSMPQHALLRAVGLEPDVAVDLTEVPMQPDDYLLLCTDGLTRMVTEEAVADIIVRERNPQRICDCLVDAANRNGGLDNVTVVLIQVPDGWWSRLTSFLAVFSANLRAARQNLA